MQLLNYIFAICNKSAVSVMFDAYQHIFFSMVDSDDDLAPPPSYRSAMDRRRKSVFAESYEPGKDDEASEKVFT